MKILKDEPLTSIAFLKNYLKNICIISNNGNIFNNPGEIFAKKLNGCIIYVDLEESKKIEKKIDDVIHELILSYESEIKETLTNIIIAKFPCIEEKRNEHKYFWIIAENNDNDFYLEILDLLDNDITFKKTYIGPLNFDKQKFYGLNLI